MGIDKTICSGVLVIMDISEKNKRKHTMIND